MNHTQQINFKSDNLDLFGRLSLLPSPTTGVLFLHGGGKSSSGRYAIFQSLQNQFSQTIASFAFDFRGCGRSQGNFEAGSLSNRLIDAKNALNYFKTHSQLKNDQIYLWGSSMGGHVACRMLADYPVKGIILQSAAAYSVAAESKSLNQEFTRIITRSKDWINSPAFQNLEAYSGKILVVYGQKDKAIPAAVRTKYQLIAKHQGGSILTLTNGSHALLNPQSTPQRQALHQLVLQSSYFIT